jgi:hypothetical protein
MFATLSLLVHERLTRPIQERVLVLQQAMPWNQATRLIDCPNDPDGSNDRWTAQKWGLSSLLGGATLLFLVPWYGLSGLYGSLFLGGMGYLGLESWMNFQENDDEHPHFLRHRLGDWLATLGAVSYASFFGMMEGAVVGKVTSALVKNKTSEQQRSIGEMVVGALFGLGNGMVALKNITHGGWPPEAVIRDYEDYMTAHAPTKSKVIASSTVGVLALVGVALGLGIGIPTLGIGTVLLSATAAGGGSGLAVYFLASQLKYRLHMISVNDPDDHYARQLQATSVNIYRHLIGKFIDGATVMSVDMDKDELRKHHKMRVLFDRTGDVTLNVSMLPIDLHASLRAWLLLGKSGKWTNDTENYWHLDRPWHTQLSVKEQLCYDQLFDALRRDIQLLSVTQTTNYFEPNGSRSQWIFRWLNQEDHQEYQLSLPLKRLSVRQARDLVTAISDYSALRHQQVPNLSFQKFEDPFVRNHREDFWRPQPKQIARASGFGFWRRFASVPGLDQGIYAIMRLGGQVMAPRALSMDGLTAEDYRIFQYQLDQRTLALYPGAKKPARVDALTQELWAEHHPEDPFIPRPEHGAEASLSSYSSSRRSSVSTAPRQMNDDPREDDDPSNGASTSAEIAPETDVIHTVPLLSRKASLRPSPWKRFKQRFGRSNRYDAFQDHAS